MEDATDTGQEHGAQNESPLVEFTFENNPVRTIMKDGGMPPSPFTHPKGRKRCARSPRLGSISSPSHQETARIFWICRYQTRRAKKTATATSI